MAMISLVGKSLLPPSARDSPAAH